MLGFPEDPGFRIKAQALGISVAVAPNRRAGSRRRKKGVIPRQAAIVPQAVDFAFHVRELLGVVGRRRHIAAIADTEKNISFPVKLNAAPEVVAARDIIFNRRLENRLLIHKRHVFQASADNLRQPATVLLLGIGEVNPAVLFVVRVQLNIEQTALANRINRRNPGNGFGEKFAILNDPQPPEALGNEHSSIPELGESPRVGEAFRDGFNFEFLLLRGDNLPGSHSDNCEQRKWKAKSHGSQLYVAQARLARDPKVRSGDR